MLHYHYRLITASTDWSTLTCVKLAFSRTSGTIYVVMYLPEKG